MKSVRKLEARSETDVNVAARRRSRRFCIHEKKLVASPCVAQCCCAIGRHALSRHVVYLMSLVAGMPLVAEIISERPVHDRSWKMVNL